VKKGICFFDIDGTLLDNRTDAVPDSALKALEALREHYYIVISTGRDMDTHYSRRYRDIVRPDAVIHLNGCKISVGEELIFHHHMDEALLEEIYAFSMESGICFGTTIGENDYYTVPEKKQTADRFYSKPIRRNFRPFEELITEHIPVTALSYAGDFPAEYPLIRQRFPQLELYTFNKGAAADVVEENFSKAEGMKRICSYYRIPIENTYAFGDSPNDIHILQEAGTGIAMGNGDEEIKAAADYVTDPIDRDGIYNACVRLGLIRAEQQK